MITTEAYFENIKAEIQLELSNAKSNILLAVAITATDFVRIPAILATGKISYAGKNKIGRDVVDFEADLAYRYHCLMEIRTGRKQLAFATLYKRKSPTI